MGIIPFVKIKAKDNYDFGYKLGSALKKRIQNRLRDNKELYRKKAVKPKEFSFYISKAKKFLPSIKKHFPNLLDEAKGMADGADIPFEELFVVMVDEEIIDFKILHCLSIGLKTKNNQLLLGNNEDWFPEYRNNGLALVKGEIKSNKFLGLGYMGYLTGSACGFNKYGIAYTDNSFVLDNIIYGVPRSFQLRALLDVKTPKEAIKTLDKKGSVGSNTMILHPRGIMSIEEYPNHHETYESKELLIHTNHPLSVTSQTKKNTLQESVLRFVRAKEIIAKEKTFSVDTLKKVFRDHENSRRYMAGICEHPQKKYKNATVATIASVILNPKDKWMLLCDTNPCKGTYKKYKL